MKNFIKTIVGVFESIALFIHQLPQNILGLLIILVNIGSVKVERENKLFRVKHLADTGISLGNYIIIDTEGCACDNCFKHESGHQMQSLYLGWLYLLVIGLPSIIGNCIDRLFHKSWSYEKRIDWYFNKQPWEHWADVLGGAVR